MNGSLKSIIIFASGTLFGAAGMYFSLKKYFETRSDEEIESVRRAYNDRMAEIEAGKSSKDGELKGPEEIDVKKKVSELNNKPDLLDYTKYFKSSGVKLEGSSELTRDAKKDAVENGLSEDELAEMESPPDDEPYTDEEDRDQTIEYEGYQLNGAHQKALEDGRPPYEIGPEDYALTCDNYEKMSLIWYTYDETLANEAEEIVDQELFVGDLIEKTGFNMNSDDVLYVRNDRLMCDLEITKVYEEFQRKE